MPTESSFPPVKLPNGDTWSFLFERTDRPFPDDKRGSSALLSNPGSSRLEPPLIPTRSELFVDAETLRSYTFAQVRQTAEDFGKGLKSSWSWRKGDVLAIYAVNDVDFPPVIWGCQWAGGVVTTANPGTNTPDSM